MVVRGRLSWIARLMLLLLVATAFALIWAVPPIQVAIHRAGTARQLQHIRLAMECYYSDYGSYPPQYLTDQQGKPAHSWRVILLPYLFKGDLYRRYQFDEPWNGPHNRLLAAEMPYEYRSPFQDLQVHDNPVRGNCRQRYAVAGNGAIEKRRYALQRIESPGLVRRSGKFRHQLDGAARHPARSGFDRDKRSWGTRCSE